MHAMRVIRRNISDILRDSSSRGFLSFFGAVFSKHELEATDSPRC